MGLSALEEKGKAVVVVFTESKGMRFGLGKLLLVIKDLRSAKGASLRRGGWHPFPLEPHTHTHKPWQHPESMGFFFNFFQ